MRRVGLLERRYLFRRETQGECRDGIHKVMRFGSADDRRGDIRLAEHPRQRQLGVRNASLLGKFGQAVHDSAIRFFRLGIQDFAELIGVKAFGIF